MSKSQYLRFASQLPDVVKTVEDNMLDRVIKILEAEPETISSSQSFRQGYVRCVRDKVKLLRNEFRGNGE